MTRFRKWALTATVVASLLVSLATAASADPGRGQGHGQLGGAPIFTPLECIDPGTGGTCP